MMGCGAAKAVQTEETNNSNVVNDNLKDISNGTNGTTARRLSKAEIRPQTPVPKSVAFEIPIDERRDSNDSTSNGSDGTRKPPPRRLVSLAEQPALHLTAEELKEKQMKAEEKRLEILGERKLKAHKYNEKFSINKSESNTTVSDQDIDNLKNENNTENNTIINNIDNNNKENTSS